MENKIPVVERCYNTVEKYDRETRLIDGFMQGAEDTERSMVEVDDVIVDGDLVCIQTKPFNSPNFEDPDRMVIKRIYEIPKKELIEIIHIHYLKKNSEVKNG